MNKLIIALTIISSILIGCNQSTKKATHTFEVGEENFLLDSARFQIRCGEMHFSRIPMEYWKHRLQMCKAMGMNTVCAYLFWNYHEFEEGKFDWEGKRDVVKFCQLAQDEGLWVILRPGPYTCAEWEMGGLPWWLLKNKDIDLRSRDSVFIAKSTAWLKEVGRVLAPMQITQGGPIIMTQVENEYGYYSNDAEYMGVMRQAVIDAGFDVPLFACNPTFALKRGFRDDLFNVVNFGSNPADGFKKLREVQKTGPLMCGEFYPGWFDTWGLPHHYGNTETYLKDLEYMLANNGSFSIYMAHGGTTFGTWAGCDRPFKPDISSYDYDAPISEAGWVTDKFMKTRELMSKYLLPGEVLSEIPDALPVISIPEFELKKSAPVFSNLPTPFKDSEPRNMEMYDQGRGLINYRTTVPAGKEVVLSAKDVRDFAWVYLNGEQIGVMDRRNRSFTVNIPERKDDAQLDILLYPMGRVNFGVEVHDRKGLHAPVAIVANQTDTTILKNWEVFNIDLSEEMLANLKYENKKTDKPAFWKASFNLEVTGDVFLDVSTWGKGILWINGNMMGRFWNIGPTQTMYVPGAWLKKGSNEIVVLDILGPHKPVIAGLKKPILNKLRPEVDFIPKKNAGTFAAKKKDVAYKGTFNKKDRVQTVKFGKTVTGRQFCIESLSTFNDKGYTAISELDILNEKGEEIPHTIWTIAYADSEEISQGDGSALNAINGQAVDYWLTKMSGDQVVPQPHRLVIDLGEKVKVSGFKYTAQTPNWRVDGRIKDYKIYVGNQLIKN